MNPHRMTHREKYRAIKQMVSISAFTCGKYPSFAEFSTAVDEGRVAGVYGERIAITSTDPRQSYRFYSKNHI